MARWFLQNSANEMAKAREESDQTGANVLPNARAAGVVGGENVSFSVCLCVWVRRLKKQRNHEKSTPGRRDGLSPRGPALTKPPLKSEPPSACVHWPMLSRKARGVSGGDTSSKSD